MVVREAGRSCGIIVAMDMTVTPPGGHPPGPARITPDDLQYRVRRAEFEYDGVRKDARTAYLLWLLTGIIGGHRFYLGDTGRSVAMLFTLGGLGVWTLADLALIGRRVRAVNSARRATIMARYGLIDG